MAGYVTGSGELLALASNDQASVDRAVLAASMIVDEAFSNSPARYSIPLVFTDIVDLDTRERFQARIEYATLTIAARILSQGLLNRRGVDNQIVKDYDDIRKWIEQIKRGQIGFPFLRSLGGVGFHISGSYEWGVDPDLYDIEDLTGRL